MGFLPDIRRIVQSLPAKRQNLLFSATMPGEILHLAEDVLDNPVRIQIGHSRPTTTVSQMLYAVDQNGKVSLLKEIMAGKDMASTLIFTRTKHRAQSLASQLQKAGYAATSLQGNLSQQKRQKALNGFRRGEFKVLVATDIAARGIDVSNISHVINFDMPATVDAYTHRIGRTGRAACTGKAFTFASREDRKIVSQIERTLGEKLVWVNQKNTSEGVPDNTSFAERPSKKSWHKAKYNCRQAGQRNGHQAGRPAKAAKTGKQEQAPVKYCKAGNRQMRKRRAAIMIDGSGNFFLNP
jgi:superfamily II DNA/RNA helicase